MKMTDELRESFTKAGFTITESNEYGRSREFTAYRTKDNATLLLIYGGRSMNIIRGEYSARFVGKMVLNCKKSASLRDLLTTIRCGCSDCVTDLKNWTP